jgi:hypothetical protein
MSLSSQNPNRTRIPRHHRSTCTRDGGRQHRPPLCPHRIPRPLRALPYSHPWQSASSPCPFASQSHVCALTRRARWRSVWRNDTLVYDLSILVSGASLIVVLLNHVISWIVVATPPGLPGAANTQNFALSTISPSPLWPSCTMLHICSKK